MSEATAFSLDRATRRRIGAIVLAAGSASRLGHRPKYLLEVQNEPLLARTLSALLQNGIDNIVVVLGHYAAQVKPIVTKFPVALVHNAAADSGQNSSLHCGLRALREPLDAVLVALADQPLLDARDIDAALVAYCQRPRTADVMVPTVSGEPGNPVIFSAAVRTAILARANNFGCRQWQAENAERVHRWDSANDHYRFDIDTPADMEMFAARTGVPLRWPAPLD